MKQTSQKEKDKRLVGIGKECGKILAQYIDKTKIEEAKEKARKERKSKKGGRPKKVLDELIPFLITLSIHFSYRVLSGIYSEIIGEPVHYTTIEKAIKRAKSNWKMKPLPKGGYLFFKEGIPPDTYFIDSSGFASRRKGDWRGTKYMIKECKIKLKRKWFKLHIICNRKGEVVACAVTEGNVNDSSVFEALVSKIPHGSVLYGDKGYFARKNYKFTREKGITFHSPPKSNARARKGGSKEYRDEIILIRDVGYENWKRITGYCERFNKEFVFAKLKTMFGEPIRAVSLKGAAFVLLNMVTLANITARF